jgi:hypothetical protein
LELLKHTQEVDILVDGVALDRGPAQLLDELLAEILNVALLGTNLEGLLAGSVKVLLLTDVGHEADDAVTLVQKVLEDTWGIETARVGETDLCTRINWMLEIT